jgi:type VI secretion system protein ImpM
MVTRTLQGESIEPQAFGWHGKLPTRGDFLGRGLPRSFLRTWDEWLQRSLAQAGERLGADALRQRLLAMPPWHGLVLPASSTAQAWSLIIVPSSDRVGRAFPLLLAESYARDALDRAQLAALHDRALHIADWLDRIGALASPKDFETGAAQLTARPWRARLDDARGSADVAALRQEHPEAGSFWWQPEPLGGMQAPRIDRWPPSEQLLLAWLGAGP